MQAKRLGARAALVLCASAAEMLAAGLDARFTYQGQLKESGMPVNGPADFRFSLWNASALGVQIGPTLTHTNISVDHGLFSAELDFGDFAFDSEERWLQIAVRHPAGSGEYVPLDERQRITAMPYTLGLHVPMSTTGAGSADLFTIKHNGTAGSAGTFQNISLTNVDPALEATAAGGAPAFAATSFSGTAVSGTATNGRAGNFLSQGNLPTVAAANTSTGPAISADGDISLVDDSSTIVFPATDATNTPMIEMFRTGTTNGARMVIAHSAGFTDFGLQYQDDGDEFHFLSAGNDVMTVDLGSRRVGIGGVNEPGYVLDVGDRMRVRDGDSSSAGIWFAYDGPFGASDRAFVGMHSFDKVGLYGASSGWEFLMDVLTGNIGVGTANPAAKLHIVGGTDSEPAAGGVLVLGSPTSANLSMDTNEIMARTNGAVSTLFLNHNGGDVRISQGAAPGASGRLVTPILQITGGADLSEQFDITPDEGAQPGMLVCIDPENEGKLVRCERAYDRRVAGVISGAGGIRTGMLMGQEASVADGQHPVALSGRVYCLADAASGSIEPGDLLTTSATPGHAMKVTDHGLANGAVIGKAMTSLSEGQGLVLLLVALQ